MRDPLFWLPIKYKLPLTIALVSLVAFGIGGFLVTSITKEVFTKQIHKGLESKALWVTNIVDRHFELAARRVEDFASDGFIRMAVAEILDGGGADIGQENSSARERLLRHLSKNKLPLVPWFVGAGVLDPKGEVMLTVPDPFEVLAAAHLPPATEIGPLMTPSTRYPFRAFVISSPLVSLDGQHQLGFLQLLIDVDSWIEGIPELAQLGDTGLARLRMVDRAGVHVSLLSGNSTSDDGEPPENSRMLEYGAELSQSDGWRLELAVDRDELLSPVATVFGRFLFVGGTLLVLNLALLFFPTRFLVRPLLQLRNAAQRIAKGDFSARVPQPASHDEIGDLAKAFNIMSRAIEERTVRLEDAAQQLAKRESQIRFERDRLETTIRSMQDGLFILNAEGKVTLANAAARNLIEKLGSDVNGDHRLDCTRRNVSDHGCLHCLSSSTRIPTSCMVNVDDHIYEIHVTPLPLREDSQAEGLYVSRDITERLAQAERQGHHERMHVVGEMAAVVAHELNNPLAAIVMFSQMLLDSLEENSPLREHAEVILRNAKTCKGTIGGLLDMAAFPKPEVCEVDLQELLADVSSVLRPLAGKTNREFKLENNADVSVIAVELQLRQVLVNLVMNAIQAGGDKRGRVTIRTAVQGHDITIDVEDDGPGIPEGIRDNIFKPFFSTKPPGVGTGLGLPTSRRIVEAHGGTLELLSSAEGRTIFRIVLPRKGTASSGHRRGPVFGEFMNFDETFSDMRPLHGKHP